MVLVSAISRRDMLGLPDLPDFRLWADVMPGQRCSLDSASSAG